MERGELERRLAEAETFIRLCHEVIAEQRSMVASLQAWGLDAAVARRHLRLFEAMQERHLDDLESALVQLDAENARAEAG